MIARFRKRATALSIASVLIATSASAQPQRTTRATGAKQMEITRKADLKSMAGPSEWFTGKVTVTGVFQRSNPARVGGGIVHFEPGARTAWHKHPLGQTLIVTEGVGWTQVEGGPILEFREGDIMWCPPEHKHWHGATPRAAMTHIAIQESLNGSPVTWMEHVTDEEYLAGPAAR